MTNFIKTTTFLLLLLFISNYSFAQTNSINHWETVIYFDDIWNYFVGTSEPATNWRELNFNDHHWLQGKGGIGYSDDDDNTIIDPTLSLYLRINFTIYDTTKIEEAIGTGN